MVEVRVLDINTERIHPMIISTVEFITYEQLAKT